MATNNPDTNGAEGPVAALPEQSPTPGGEDPRDEEVRVALALNGGVSLAVWMGGCAVELDCARRAHLGPEPAGAHSSPEDPGTRSVYHGLCKALGRVLVLDIMSGASAGGINGGLLAAAIRHARWLPSEFMRDRWLNLGDASTLLQRISEPSPTALMQGKAFYTDLLDTFGQIVGEPSNGGRPKRAEGGNGGVSVPTPVKLPRGQELLSELNVQLVVMTTNLVGEIRTFRDYWGQELSAREYRGRFRFRTRADYTAETLAVASRSSASFPLAFEPWHVEGAAGVLADFPQARWVLDGGLLDNAPIADALALIPTRPARRQVQRFLCYVNAEPVEAPALSTQETQPSVDQVVGAVVGLPRKAPFVDQLYAIERATRSALFGGELPALGLLEADLDSVTRIAGALLPSYRRRRLLLSIEEIVHQAADAQDLVESLPQDPSVTWLPNSLDPMREGRWQWGVSAVHRTIQLSIDLLTRTMHDAPAVTRLRLLDARQDMDAPLLAVESMMKSLLAKPATDVPASTALERAEDVMELFDPLPALLEVASAIHRVADLLDREVATGLFGEDYATGDGDVPTGTGVAQPAFEHFLRRMLAVEVLRRSLEGDNEVRPTQELRFAQLTPYAPSPIFTATPLEDDGWCTPEEKLLGLGLGHFAGFYRRSWRANDFMWGRLDAAARVVDLLVSPRRAEQLAQDGAQPTPWETLADTLLNAQPAAEQLWLLEEMLGTEAGERLTGTDGMDARRTVLRGPLVDALRTDLTSGEQRQRGTVTRVMFARAAQAEILHGELGTLKRESLEDARLGAGSEALQISDDLELAIEELREQPTLPRRLTGEDEIASDLAVQTATHAGLVGLAMLRTLDIPLNRALFALRAPLLLANGMVARQALYRAAALAAYWSLAVFLASRVLTIDPNGSPTIGLLRSTAEVMTLVAVVGVFGVATLPVLRAWRIRSWVRRLTEGAWALALLASGVLAAVLLARYTGGLSWELLLTAPGAQSPSATVLGICLALALGTPLVGIAAGGRGVGDALLRSSAGGALAAIGVTLVAATLIATTASPVLSAFGSSTWWRVAIAILAVVGAPACAAGYLFRRR